MLFSTANKYFQVGKATAVSAVEAQPLIKQSEEFIAVKDP